MQIPLIQGSRMLILLVSRAKNSYFEHSNQLAICFLLVSHLSSSSPIWNHREAPAIFESRFNGETSSGPENHGTEGDLYCVGYVSKQTTAKEPNLALQSIFVNKVFIGHRHAHELRKKENQALLHRAVAKAKSGGGAQRT